MKSDQITLHANREASALSVSKWGNLFMGAAGVLAAWISNSQALLVDGLFSLVGFAGAIVAARVSASVGNLPDQRRPLGYAADESIFVTFRALSLLGLVAFAIGAAVLNIVDYATGGDIPELRYGPILIYFVLIFVVCSALAINHHLAWKATGQKSEILRLEAQAAMFDGVVTLAAGAGLCVMPFLRDGPLGWIAPIGDSVVVLLLCGIVIGRYSRDFMRGIGELAGIGIAPEQVKTARDTVQPVLDTIGGRLVDFSIIRLGRMHQAQVYFDPAERISSETVDSLTRQCDQVFSSALGPTTTIILISEHGRVLPGVLDDDTPTIS